MADDSPDPIALAQRVVALVDTGRRNSTYKLATLMAIIDVCVENSPAPDGSLAVPIQELAHRVVAYYWPQSREYARHGLLKQNTQLGRTIPSRVAETRAALAAARVHTPEAAREDEHPAYLRLVREVELTLAQQPLTHLQTPNGASEQDDFLFDASALHKKVTRAELSAHGPIVLLPGVAQAFRRLAPLLKPVIEVQWTADVVQLNRAELEMDDLAGFLFGGDRTALAVLAPHLRELQDNHCFYCGRALSGQTQVDHVLPWSRVPIDGVANLVLSDARCNLNKSATLPVREHVDRALDRPDHDLAEVSRVSRVPVLSSRTRGAAEGIYGSLPRGTQLWRGYGSYTAW